MGAGKILLLLPLLVLAAAFAGQFNFPTVHGVGGAEVCLADPSTASPTAPCPSAPPMFDGPVGQQLRVGIYVNNSAPLNGFSIILKANQSFVKPAGVDLTGSVLLGTPITLLECLRGVLIHGNVCSANDTIDTMDLQATNGLGTGLTLAPTTGLFFTAIFNITATTTAPISIGFQSGCGGSGASNDACATITNGSNTPNNEAVQISTFNNADSTTMAFVSVSANRTSFGPEFPGTPNAANITGTARNGYPLSTDSVTFTDVASSGLTATISGTNPCATLGVGCSITLSLSAVASGNYSVTVYGTYATIDPSGNPDTLVGTVTLNLQIYDFSYSLTPTTVTFISGEIGTTTAKLSSANGFSGSVTLSNVVVAGLTVTYNPMTVTLSNGGTATSTVTFKASPASATTYHPSIKATSGSRSKSITETVTVKAPFPTFYLLASPSNIGPIDAGSSATSTITVTYVNGFTGTVSLTSSTSGANPALNQSSVTATHNVTLTVSPTVAANYAVTVTGTGGAQNNNVTLSIDVVDFNVTASNTMLSIGQSESSVSVITVSALNSFTGTISLTATASTGLTATLSKNSIINSGSLILNVTIPPSTSPGAYNVNVTGVSSPLSHAREIFVTVIQSNFTMVAAPATIVVRPHVDGPSTITLTSVFGFAGTVALSIAAPTGVNASLSATSVNLVKDGHAVSILHLNATNLGSYHVNVTGVSGSLTNVVRLVFNVSITDFTISASPTALILNAMASGTSVVTVVPMGGFSSNVTLTASASSGLTATLNSNLIVRGTGTSTLTLSANVAGNYTVTVTGTGGGLTHTTSTITVQVQDFTLSAPTSAQTVITIAATSTVTVTALNHFAGTVSLATNSSAYCNLAPSTVIGSGTSSLSCTFPVAGSYAVKITGSLGSLSHSAVSTITVGDFSFIESHEQQGTITIEEGSSNYVLVTFSSQSGFTGSLGFVYSVLRPPSLPSSAPIPSASFNPPTMTLTSNGQGVLNVTLTVGAMISNGPYVIKGNATDSTTGLLHQFQITIDVPIATFSVGSSPTSVAIGPGGTGKATVTVTSSGGLNDTISFPRLTYTKSGLTCSSLGGVYVSRDSSSSATLSCSATVGIYGQINVTITAHGGSPCCGAFNMTGTATFVLADFALNPTPTGVLVNTSQTGHAQIAISWTGQYNGTVSLKLISPSGLNASLSSSSITGSGTVTVNVSSATSGTYNLVVNATSGPDSHAVTLTVTVSPTGGGGTDFTYVYVGAGVGIAAVAAAGFLLLRRGKRPKK